MGYFKGYDVNFQQKLPEPKLENCIGLVDFAEFSGEPLESVVEKVRAHHKLTNEDFNETLARLGDKQNAAREFYTLSLNYVYDILGATNSFQGTSNKLNKFLTCGGIGIMEVMKQAGPKFLEFGGGSGLLCQMMATWGMKEVTYVDVDSYVAQFAVWRFEKYGLDVETKLISVDDFELDSTYDIIFTDAVWEHLTPIQQLTYVDKLCNKLNPNGLFVLIVDLKGEGGGSYPMHFNVEIGAVHDRVRKCGLTRVEGSRSATAWRKI